MKKIKLFFNILLYVSLTFLIYYLIKFDYLNFRNVAFHPFYLIISFVFLFTGFITGPFAWRDMLAKHKIFISYKDTFVSEGLSIFAKYIPGKIMIVLGSAVYVATKSQSFKFTSLISLKTQLIALWIALFIGIIPLLFIFKESIHLALISFIFIVLIVIVLHSKKLHLFINNVIRRIIKQELSIPLLTFKESKKTIFYYLVMWLFWSSGFYFFTLSIVMNANFSVIFLFALASSLGMLAVIIPGGLGIRESIIVFYLHQVGIPIEIATTVSILGRLWYLTGECFFFGLAVIWKRF